MADTTLCADTFMQCQLEYRTVCAQTVCLADATFTLLVGIEYIFTM